MLSAVDLDTSRLVADHVSMTAKRCRANALAAVEWLGKKYQKKHWLYCEGWMTWDSFLIPIEHGWVRESLSSMVIDPTLVHRPDFTEDTHYYAAGIEVSFGDIDRKVRREITKENHAIVFHYGFGGNQHAGYMNAMQDIMAVINNIKGN